MLALMTILAVLGISGTAVFLALWLSAQSSHQKEMKVYVTAATESAATNDVLTLENEQLRARNTRLERFARVVDAEEAAKRLILEAKRRISVVEEQLKRFSTQTHESAKRETDQAALKAETIVREARQQAEQMAGEAYQVLQNKLLYESAVKAIRNKIDGYGDEYLIATDTLLDDLAEEFGHKEAGAQLKVARAKSKGMLRSGEASVCDYTEASRRQTAQRFVVDAFNGKVDTALAKVKHDNVGKLEQEIRDAFALVNLNGQAFRNARITETYLAARLEELKWAAIAQYLKLESQEEQRRLREQVREEEKAKRERERAIREADKEQQLIKDAMAKAEAAAAVASEAQKAQFQQQLAELSAKLKESEERNQRAISMAQQTRRGFVYIISNMGSFGDNVFKIGLTRRLDPMDRVWELGDSSVPFDFDVHAFIWAEDAPALEHQLHKLFVLNQINKVNHRKEFFRAKLAEIRQEIERLGLNVKWTMVAEAREYKESQSIEKRIAEDPVAKEMWINRQLSLEGAAGFDEGDEDLSTASKALEVVEEEELEAVA